jgi:hypothetical protein
MRIVRAGFWTLAIAVLMPRPALAWDQEREGFWIGFGFGYGSARVSCDDCGASAREGGIAGFVKLGGTLNRKVLLGAEINFWTKAEDQIDSLNFGNASFTVTYYPWVSSGFFVKGGAGLSFVDTQVLEGSVIRTLDLGTGFGAIAGIGYDLRIRRNLSITPVFNVYMGRPGDLREGRVTIARNWRYNVVELSVGLTFH